jgi:hypothetical protein
MMKTLATTLISAVATYRSRAVGTLALLIALGLVVRRAKARKKNLLVTDLNHVGRTEWQKEYVNDEFDVIIIGGGKPSEKVDLKPFLNK